MHIISVNVGTPRSQAIGSGEEITGIYKMPVEEARAITRLGLDGDFIGDDKNHGGPDQAVFIYGEGDYLWWSRTQGRTFEPGTFGENLTISGLETADLGIGDRFHVGGTILEVTAPRTPCMTLARRMGDPMFVKVYRRAERPGVYCRVLREGLVEPGAEVRHESLGGDAVKAIQIFRMHYVVEKDEASLRKFLQAPISLRARASMEKHLRRILEKAK